MWWKRTLPVPRRWWRHQLFLQVECISTLLADCPGKKKRKQTIIYQFLTRLCWWDTVTDYHICSPVTVNKFRLKTLPEHQLLKARPLLEKHFLWCSCSVQPSAGRCCPDSETWGTCGEVLRQHSSIILRRTWNQLCVSGNHIRDTVCDSHLNKLRFLVRAAARDESVSSDESLNMRAGLLTLIKTNIHFDISQPHSTNWAHLSAAAISEHLFDWLPGDSRSSVTFDLLPSSEASSSCCCL